MTSIADQTIVITGATDGLGRALAHELAPLGPELVLHGRSEEKGQELLAELRAATGNERLSYERADFSSLAEIQSLADRLLSRPRIDVLVNNAGMGVELDRRESRDGLELTFQVDYLSTYILSCRLAPLLVDSAPARIVNVTSAGQAPIDFDDVMLRSGWSGGQAYCQAKLAQIMLTMDLADVLDGTGVTVNSLHPASYMPTKIVTHLFTPQSTVAEGVRNTARLVTDPEYARNSGLYVNRSQVARAHAQAHDEGARARLRRLSEELTGTPMPAVNADASPR
ncbi:SDR family NAD(P)-dependent oxidoreductase [Streptomyces rubradiris]|uniref:3-oxoacyl-ACP reductase n=1 Tax=Streptomyces rubradiris TaxID=285531 RepID=A0ABQ3R882_STRRR|nr:SDR family NAD(P)-dependent oxidoreductase [Streptomyces rubradiris]GHH22844.1 3-oxoacyl-ACP reductase [Streptomyces rubradiris]GHI52056.1 3-oxoacyl-ACP reductase [Streptomyces rubradiris]